MRCRSIASSFLAGFLLLASLTGSASATGPGGWDKVGHGSTASTPSLDGTVDALNLDNPGTMYVGGSFTAAGGVAGTNRIAKWNGSAWSAVNSTSSKISDGDVRAIAYDATTGKVYAGGAFHNAGGNADADFVAVSDGTSWAPVCDGAVPLVAGTVNALQIIGRTLYVGGTFADGGGIASADRLVACNLDTGVASSTIVNPLDQFNGPGIIAMTADSNGVLYVGGGFTNADGIAAADDVAYMDGTGWHAMGSGGGTCGCAVDSFVRSLAAVGTDVYVGTDAVDVAGIAQADNVAKWNGSTWSAVGSNTAADDGWFPAATTINGLTDDGTTLYATGNFGNANGDPTADEIASYDGSTWHPVGSDGAGNGPLNARGFAVAIFHHRLYAGGNFTSAGGDSQAQHLAVYPGFMPVCSAASGHGATGGAPLQISLKCRDKNAVAIHYVIRSGPSHGEVGAVSDHGKVTYTPTVGYTGPDEFTYRGSNDDGVSNTATVSIDVAHPGFSNAGTNVALKLGSLMPSAAGRLSFKARNTNTFALRAVSITVSSRSKVAVKGQGRKIVTFVKSLKAVTVRPGKAAGITSHVRASKLALLKRLGHVKVRVSVVLKGPHGSRTTTTTKGTLHAPK